MIADDFWNDRQLIIAVTKDTTKVRALTRGEKRDAPKNYKIKEKRKREKYLEKKGKKSRRKINKRKDRKINTKKEGNKQNTSYEVYY